MFEESGDLDRERWVLVVIAEAVDQRWRSFVEARAVGIDIYGQFRVIIGPACRSFSSIVDWMPRPKLTDEQASLLTSREYEHLQSTYSSLVKSLSPGPNNQLSLTTLEEQSYTITVTSEGWKVLDGGQLSERERTWEMVEDLLRSVSPLFKQGWDLMLLEKLNSIADAQGSPSPSEN